VIAAVDTGTGAYVAALLFQVSVSYIYKALIRRRKTGEVTARRSGCGPKPKLAPHDDALRARVAAEPDITLDLYERSSVKWRYIVQPPWPLWGVGTRSSSF